ncbi:MAG TPA: hypothetical protein VD948_00045, partial [Rhodothermales bacterium]|nr:hypothetical protein [Rhodothermales bacterium]
RFPTRLRAGATYATFGSLVAAEVEAAFERRQGRQEEVVLDDGVPRQQTTEPDYTFAGTLLRFGVERPVAPGFAIRAGVDGVGREGAFAGARPAAGVSFERPAGGLVLRGEYGFVLEPYGTGAMHVATLRVLL